MDEFLQDFIRESEENITELNNALLELESDPDDEAAMDSIFRTAHTLKGNFAAMGFVDASKLAHALEDLLEEIRQGRMAVRPEVMDLVFDGVDRIELILGEIADDGESSTDPSATIEQVRAVIDADGDAETGAETDEPAANAPTGADDSTADTEDSPVDTDDSAADADDPSTGANDSRVEAALASLSETNALADLDAVFYADIGMKPSEMKGVDAMFVLNAVTDAFDLVGSHPDVEAIQDGDYDDGFGVLLAAAEAETVESAMDGIGKVESATVTDVTARLAERATGESDGAAAGDESDGTTADGTAAEGTAGKPSDLTDAEPERSLDSEPERSPESTPDRAADAADASEAVEEIKSIRVDVEQLDDLHSLVEQLVTSRIKLRRSIEQEELSGASDNLDELDKITSSLQDTVMDMRLVPMKKVVDKFPRLIRDLARSQDKEIDFVMEGTDIELDRTILNEISDPLMHLLRNAADHGIESPDEREAAGKSREGRIRLTGERERDRVTIAVEDDGRGLDVDSIRRKAVEKGVMSRERVTELDDSEVYELVFHAGFSTSEEITDVSGRGVGMDVVKNTIKRLDGTIDVDSEHGEGTSVSLTLPVTVAIVKVLFVESGEEEYGIPIKNVDEIGRMGGVKTVEGKEVITHDDRVYPLVRLGEALNVPGALANGDGMLVRIKQSERQVAIHCDSVTRQEEVVVKPFEGILSGIPGLSGAAVLGEGDVVTILDAESL